MYNATAWTAAPALHVGSGGPNLKKTSPAEASGILQRHQSLHRKSEEKVAKGERKKRIY
jgi:hypothetical protein